MKKSFYFALLTALAALMLTSCGYKRPQSIALPSADSLSVYTPKVDSLFGQYVDLIPASYVLDLTDSIPSMTIKVRFLKNVVSEGVDQLQFFPDSTKLVLVDSLGEELPYITLQPDSIMLKRFATMTKNGAGSEAEFSFISAPISDDVVRQIESSAKTIKLKGLVDYYIDAAMIDRMLSKFERSINSARSALAAGNGHVYGYNMMAYTGGYEEARIIKGRLARIADKMTPEQRERFNRAESRRPKKAMP